MLSCAADLMQTIPLGLALVASWKKPGMVAAV
jgi:hypothetical protein